MEVWIPTIVNVVVLIIVAILAIGRWQQSSKQVGKKVDSLVEEFKIFSNRLGIAEKQQAVNSQHRTDFEKEMSKPHSILSECLDKFMEVTSSINNLTGKVETLTRIVKRKKV